MKVSLHEQLFGVPPQGGEPLIVRTLEDRWGDREVIPSRRDDAGGPVSEPDQHDHYKG